MPTSSPMRRSRVDIRPVLSACWTLMQLADQIRTVSRNDVAALKGVVDATGLFPSHLLDDMLEPFLAGERTDELWLTFDEDDGPLALAYSAPERMTDGTNNLLLIAVRPDHQGRGIGQALMSQIEASLSADEQRVLLVETSGLPEFDRTREFYRRLGYSEEARIRDYYAAGDDKVVFWKTLG
jgi:ribosomal protein S18 acetylase RimI-like enzyme